MSDWKEQEIINLSVEWAQAIRSGYVESVMRLYDDKAVLWGTLSQEMRADRESIRRYFTKFEDHEGLNVEFTRSLIRIFGDIAINSGNYTFSWREQGRQISVPARFSFIYHYEYGSWLIIDHHSSILPDSPFDASKYFVDESLTETN